jgi:hypothetical protein
VAHCGHPVQGSMQALVFIIAKKVVKVPHANDKSYIGWASVVGITQDIPLTVVYIEEEQQRNASEHSANLDYPVTAPGVAEQQQVLGSKVVFPMNVDETVEEQQMLASEHGGTLEFPVTAAVFVEQVQILYSAAVYPVNVDEAMEKQLIVAPEDNFPVSVGEAVEDGQIIASKKNFLFQVVHKEGSIREEK